MERPCIHVSLLAGADPALYRWVEIGAEEEGVPTRRVALEGDDVVSLAYHAAQSSRLSIGVGISGQAVVLHEQHMPAARPVLIYHFGEDAAFLCRLMGANAARMGGRRPLRLDVEVQPAPVRAARPAIVAVPVAAAGPAEKALPAAAPNFEPAQLAQIIAIVVRKLQERGL